MKKTNILDKITTDLRTEEEEYYADQKISNSFWTIKNACDTKETGQNYPQVKTVIGGNYQFEKPNSVRNIRFDNIPTEDFIDFGTLQIHKTSKLSDTISAGGPSAHGFYLNERAKDIFLKFNLGEYKCFQLNVEHKGNIFKYFYLQVKNDFIQHVDFDRSNFYVQKGMINGPRELIKFKSVNELMLLKDELFDNWKKGNEYKEIGFKKFVLNNSFPAIDIFSFRRLGSSSFITKIVKETIERERLTGFQIDEQRKVFK